MSEHARLAAADLDHAQQLLARAERAEGEVRELRAHLDEAHPKIDEIARRVELLLSERDALAADNEALRSALGGLAGATTAYFNKRGADHAMRKGNEDIFALADALSVAGPILASPHPGSAIVTAARAWRDAVLTPDADIVVASQALLDAVENTPESGGEKG